MAGNQSDGSITINTSVDKSGAVRDIKSMSNDMRKALDSATKASDKSKASIEKQIDSYQKLGLQIEKQERTVQKYREQLEALDNQPVKTDAFKQLEKDIQKAETALNKLYERRDKLQETGGMTRRQKTNLGYDISNAEANLARLQQTKSNMYQAGTAIDESATLKKQQAAMAQLAAEEQKLEMLNRKLGNSFNSIHGSLSQAGADMSNLGSQVTSQSSRVSSMVGALGRLGAAAKRAAGSLASMAGRAIAKGLDRIKSSITSIGDNAKKAQKPVLTFIKAMIGVRGLYMLFRKLREAIVSGFQSFAQYSGDFNAKMSAMKSSSVQLKYNLTAALAPLASALVPMITSITNALNRAIEALSKFIAMATGKSSYVRATKQNINYAKSLDKTSEAADNASKSLASFDKLNVLNDNSGSSGGSGAGGEATRADAFETVKIDNPMDTDSWGQSLSNFLDLLNNEFIPSLDSSLQLFAGKLNDFNKKLYDAFTFPGVLEKVRLFGANLADAFNHFIDSIDFHLIGQTIGAGLNLALNLATSFIYEFDWVNLGTKLSDLVNGVFEEIDGYEIGRLIWARFKIGFETLAGFLAGLDFSEIFSTAGDMVIGFLDSITETLNNIDWQTLGEQLVNAVKAFLVDIDWTGVIESLMTLLATAIASAVEFVVGLAKALGKLIASGVEQAKDYFGNKIDEAGGNVAEGILSGILEGLKNIGKWIKDHIFKPFIDGFKNAFDIHSPSKVMAQMGVYIVEGLKEGIGSIIDTVVTIFKDTLSKIQEVWAGVSEWFKTNVADKISSKFSDMKSKVKEHFSNAWSGIKDKWKGASDWFSSNVSNKIKNNFKDTPSYFRDKFSSAFANMKNAFSGTANFFGGLHNTIRNKFSDLGTKIGEAIGGTFRSAINSVLRTVENAINAIPRAINGAISTLNKLPGVNIGRMSTISLPRLAQGAVIPPNKEFMAILGDQKRGTNIEAPLDTIKQAVAEVLASTGGGNSGEYTFVAQLDGRTIFEEVVKQNQLQVNRTGSSLLVY